MTWRMEYSNLSPQLALPVRSEKAVVIGIVNGGEEGSTALIIP